MQLKKYWFKLTHWESWHYRTKYIPLAPVWLWYCLKARSFWFFTASNPTITFGGFEGEGKEEIYVQLPKSIYPESILINPGMEFSSVEKLVDKHQFSYPFVVKPDVGLMGFMFRKITSLKELKRYHQYITRDYMVQKLVDLTFEVSVFYYRHPATATGTISGFLLKEPPFVTGDGISTLWELIQKNIDLKYNLDAMETRHKSRLDMVLPKGEKFILSYASNRSQGGKLTNLHHEIDEKLLAVFDGISNHSGQLYYGRYDIKCASIDSLKNGTDFSILEYNGAGAGIQHIYGNGLSLWQAWATILRHWKMLYQISAYNHKVNKVPYWEHKKGKKFLKTALVKLKELQKLDVNFTDF